MIIGLSGLAGSGKTTAARFLSDRLNIPRRPFAYPLKAMVGALGIPAEVLDGPAAVKELPSEKLCGHSVRHVLQTLGTEWGRNILGADFWVKQWENGLGPQGCVAEDCRFANEAAAIQSRGGIIIRVERWGAGAKVGATHASEQIGSLPYDWLIENNHSVEDFERELLDRVRWAKRSTITEELQNVR